MRSPGSIKHREADPGRRIERSDWRRRVWRGAALGLLVGFLVTVLALAYGLSSSAGPIILALSTVALLALSALVGGFFLLAGRLLRGIPRFYGWVLAASLLPLAIMLPYALSVLVGLLVVFAGLVVTFSLVGAALAGLRGARTPLRLGFSLAALALGLVGLVAGGTWLLGDGSPATPPVHATLEAGEVRTLDLPDPSQPGPYAVRTLYYGSGLDRHRPEYGAEVDMTTATVDGSALLEGWSGLRRWYWGFGPEALPINGRVWYPEGEGPFPLVLIVHGNAEMTSFSDPGYAYLGELMASRGFIFVSVDQNFLNLSQFADLLIFASLREENDARGWLLLEHLSVWRQWNETPDNPFYERLDMDNIALVGHSRGGEAVAIAAAFNHLPYYPDDASLAFDYGFGIRSVVAIAPSDGQYEPTGRPTPLENVNYLVIQGAHDMDVISFLGMKQYERVALTGEQFRFKAALYVRRANHGQFNTVWGRKDVREPVQRLYNLQQLMPAEDQQQIARVYTSAFLEATLRGETGYLPLFRDAGVAGAWLPATVYLNRIDVSGTVYVSTFQEDLDLTTTTLPGGRQHGENLTVWREQLVRGKWFPFETNAAFLGWDRRDGGETASYAIILPAGGLSLSVDSALVFALADAGEDPNPKAEGSGQLEEAPIDLSIELVDGNGEVVRLPLSHVMPLQPRPESQVAKAAWMNQFLPSSETVFQSYAFPLVDFQEGNTNFDPDLLREVRFVFDRAQAGVVILNDVGFLTDWGSLR